MTEARPQQEPSMEEILSSIRRIISEDDHRAPEATPGPASAPPTAEDDVLELTEMVWEAPKARVPDHAPAPIFDEPRLAPAPSPAVTEPRSASEPETPQPHPESAPVAIQQPPISEPAPVKDTRIMSQETELASAAALSILSQLIDRDRKLNEEGRQMIEAAAREKIVPLLREWMDGNLAQLTREVVREEIQRLMARAFGKEI